MRTLLTILLLTISLAFASVSVAREDSSAANLVIAQSGGKTLNEAVEQVRRQYPGRIVSAETRIQGDREVHHIKVLTEDGKVKTVKVNGRRRGSA